MDATTAVTHELTKKIFKSMQLRNRGNLEGSRFVLAEIREDIEALIHHTESEIRQEQDTIHV